MKSFQITEYGAALGEADAANLVPTDGEVLVRVAGCGVCHSDVHIWHGHFDMGDGRKIDMSRSHQLPFTLGHEIAGEVEALGSGASGCAVGERVVVYPWIGCGECPTCASGEEQFCAKPRNLGVHRDGGYATHVLVPDARYLLPVGDLPIDLAATYACSGLTAYGALKKVKDKAEARHLMIIGAGGVGLAALMIAPAMMQSEIIVVDIDPAKRHAALAAGAAHAIDPAAEDARKQVVKLTGGGPLAVVDFVGSDKSVTFGFNALGVTGTLVVVGLFGGAAEFSVPLFPLKGVSVVGSYVGSPKEMAELMALVGGGAVKPLPVATRPLDQAGQTLEDLEAGRIVGRVVLTP